jgi:quinol monooxygenase YgiN
MIIIHSQFPVKEDCRNEFLDRVTEVVDDSRSESGVIQYRASVSVRDENLIEFFERYEDMDALIAHSESSHFQEFMREVSEWLDGESEIIRYDVDAATPINGVR